jgi:hypothetical protein
MIGRFKCKNCGKLSVARTTGGAPQQYCSNSCNQQASNNRRRESYNLKHGKPANIKCEQCGKVVPGRRSNQKKFCSTECCRDARYEKWRTLNPVGSTPTIQCGFCKKPMVRKTVRHLYCSPSCQFRSKRRTLSRQCQTCGNQLGRGQQKFCSPECRPSRSPEYTKSYNRVWRAHNKRKIQALRTAYKERANALSAAWRKRNSESVKRSQQRWNEIHKQRRRTDPKQRKREYEYHKTWRLKNPEKHLADVKRRAERQKERRRNDPVWRARQLARVKQLYELKKLKEDYGERRVRNVMRAKRYYERMRDDPEYQEKRRAYARKKQREARSDPIKHARKKASLKAWREKNLDRVKLDHAKRYYEGPPNPKGELQWLQKSRVELRNVRRLLKSGLSPRVFPSLKQASTPHSSLRA